MSGVQSKRLLVVSCSALKRGGADPTPAQDMYVGPLFTYLRRVGLPNEKVDVYVISAEYGLIDIKKPVMYYDRYMNFERAVELSEGEGAKLKALLLSGLYESCLLCLSVNYMIAVQLGLSESPIPIDVTSGPDSWLYIDSWLNS